MRSVRQKLFVQVGILVLVLVALSIMVNSFLLESYYTSQLKNKLVGYYDTINGMNPDAYSDELDKFIDIESSSNVDIMITDEAWDIIYTSNSYYLDEKMREKIETMPIFKGKKFRPMFQFAEIKDDQVLKEDSEPGAEPNHPPVRIEEIEMINDQVSFYYAYTDPMFSNKILVLSGTLDSGNVIELKVPVISIHESIAITNQFTVISGIVLLCIAFIYAYILSATFTKPIREINATTKQIKALKFDQKCHVHSLDEIGELADNINDMSEVLSEAIESKDHKNNQLETLVNNVSHELKTPLALLQGYAEGIQLNIVKDEEKAKFYSEVIVDEAKKMNRIVESLLTIKQFASDETRLFYKDFSITDLIQKTIKKYEPLLKTQNLQIQFETGSEIIVHGDAFYIEQVLMNYLSNAIQYVEAPFDIKIVVERLSDRCRVKVFNSFEPTTEAILEPIWDKFYKLDKARTRDRGGHGLGLSIVKSIQEAHGQSYGVNSVEDGICFWFDIALK